MASAYMKDEKKLLPCAAFLNGEYGVKDIYAGVPVIIGKNGIEKIEEIELDEIEVGKTGVKIIGMSNISSHVGNHASFALSNNYNNWIQDFYDQETNKINFNFDDEIINSSVLVFNRKIRNERFS